MNPAIEDRWLELDDDASLYLRAGDVLDWTEPESYRRATRGLRRLRRDKKAFFRRMARNSLFLIVLAVLTPLLNDSVEWDLLVAAPFLFILLILAIADLYPRNVLMRPPAIWFHQDNVTVRPVSGAQETFSYAAIQSYRIDERELDDESFDVLHLTVRNHTHSITLPKQILAAAVDKLIRVKREIAA